MYTSKLTSHTIHVKQDHTAEVVQFSLIPAMLEHKYFTFTNNFIFL